MRRTFIKSEDTSFYHECINDKLDGSLYSLGLTEVFPGDRDRMLIRLERTGLFGGAPVMDGYIAFDHIDDTGSVYNYFNHEKTGRVTIAPTELIFEPDWY